LRLRDLGGIIVIDFIDMNLKKHNQEVEKALKTVLKKDRAKTKVLRISNLGLLEMTRQRLRSSLGTGEYLDCPVCDGHGKIRSPEMTALSVFRRIKSQAIKPDITEIRATVPTRTAEYLLNNMRSLVVHLEQAHQTRVIVLAKDHLPEHAITVEAFKKEIEEPTSVESELPEIPVMEGTEEPEEETAVDTETKRPRKPGRRRRRSKKRPTTAGTEETPGISTEGKARSEQIIEPTPLPAPLSRVGTEPEFPAVADTSADEGEKKGKKSTATRSWLRKYIPFG
jgi:ribonuclease E